MVNDDSDHSGGNAVENRLPPGWKVAMAIEEYAIGERPRGREVSLSWIDSDEEAEQSNMQSRHSRRYNATAFDAKKNKKDNNEAQRSGQEHQRQTNRRAKRPRRRDGGKGSSSCLESQQQQQQRSTAAREDAEADDEFDIADAFSEEEAAVAIEGGGNEPLPPPPQTTPALAPAPALENRKMQKELAKQQAREAELAKMRSYYDSIDRHDLLCN